jgi:hypothetical protein
MVTMFPYFFAILMFVAYAIHVADWLTEGTFLGLYGFLMAVCFCILFIAPLIWFIPAFRIWRRVELWFLVRRWLIFALGYVLLGLLFNTDQAKEISEFLPFD